MHIQLIAKRESTVTGTFRYANDLYQGLKEIGLHAELTFPSQTRLPASLKHGLKNARIDPETFFANYPLRANLNGADVYHLTGQMLATLLLFQHFPRPVVVSVLDIIPYIVQYQPEMNTFRHPGDKFFYQLALTGLRRANLLIAISHYTRQTLIESLRLPADRIHVAYPGVDLGRFHPMRVPQAFWSKYGLYEGMQYVLFVGSEDPRKNLSTLIRVFALVRQHMPGVKLLKVGPAQYTQERQKLLTLINSLNLERDVFFLNYVPEEDLPLFYNAAELLVMPSSYEGFGLPVVEAMACGTPVIYSRAGSLPEVGGEAGIQVDPNDVQGMVKALLTLLNHPEERAKMTQAGLEQAAKFALDHEACAVREIYERVIKDF